MGFRTLDNDINNELQTLKEQEMTPEEKQERLKELSKPNNILSDQEIEEKERLEEELSIIHQEETQSFNENNIDLGLGKVISIPKKRKSLLDLILNKIRKKPVTWSELEQLKLERQKAILKKDIAVANYIRKNPQGKPRQTKTTKNNETEKEFNSSYKDFRKMSGSNDKEKYKGLTG